MVFETAIAEVQQIAGWRGDKTTEIGNALKYAQSQRELPGRTYPWFLRQTKTITTVVGQHFYSLPAGYIQDTEERDGNLFMYSSVADGSKSRTIFLKKMSFKDLQEKFFGTWPSNQTNEQLSDTSEEIAPGVPDFYALTESGIYLYPVPDAVYTLNWKCWAADTTLGAGVENSWLRYTPWTLIGEAAVKICSDLGNKDGLTTAQGILSRADTDLFRATIGREEAGRKRSMGSRL